MTAQQANAIQSVCIVGNGPIARLARLAFARKLPQAAVCLIRSPDYPVGLCDSIGGALPSLRHFHAYLGIDDRDLVARGVATHRLATRYSNWSRSGSPWHLVHCDVGQPADGVPFHQIWAATHRDHPNTPPFDSFSAATVLARDNRFPVSREPFPNGFVDSALRIDMPRYGALLDTMPPTAAAAEANNRAVGVVLTDTRTIESLVLANGERVTADLFVDCSGPSAMLMAAIDPAFDDWAAWCAFNHLTIVRRELAAPHVRDEVTATPHGWDMVIPHGDHQLVMSATASPRPASVEMVPGARPRPWIGNVVAIGDAAAVIPPILPVAHTLAANAIERVLAHLPGCGVHAETIAEYNRRSAQEMERVRDLLIALHVGGKSPVPIWPLYPITATLPESLALTFDQFDYRGRLPFFEEEQIDLHGWLCIMLGMGSIPRHPDPLSLAVPRDAAGAGMDRLAQTLGAFAAAMPAYPDWLAQVRSDA